MMSCWSHGVLLPCKDVYVALMSLFQTYGNYPVTEIIFTDKLPDKVPTETTPVNNPPSGVSDQLDDHILEQLFHKIDEDKVCHDALLRSMN